MIPLHDNITPAGNRHVQPFMVALRRSTFLAIRLPVKRIITENAIVLYEEHFRVYYLYFHP
jgi:hypothetical protein